VGTRPSIGDGAFQNQNQQLTSLTFADDSRLVSIGADAFFINQITSVVIPPSVRSIGQSAFAHNGILSVTFADGIEYIANRAFEDNLLNSVVIPASVRYLRYRVFAANRLYTITIGAGVTVNNAAATMGALGASFIRSYEDNDSLAGTYTYAGGGNWNFTAP